MSGDWQRATRQDALTALELALANAADEAHQHLVEQGFDEDDLHAGMQKVHAALDQARQRSMASIDVAFTRGKAAH